MIVARLSRDKDGLIKEFQVTGHAGYDRAGKDIICSAVSAVVYTALGAMQELCEINDFKEQDGKIRWFIPKSINDEKAYKVKIILDSMAIGLKQIEFENRKYLHVIDEEV
jgi:uncharacterized protein